MPFEHPLRDLTKKEKFETDINRLISAWDYFDNQFEGLDEKVGFKDSLGDKVVPPIFEGQNERLSFFTSPRQSKKRLQDLAFSKQVCRKLIDQANDKVKLYYSKAYKEKRRKKDL